MVNFFARSVIIAVLVGMVHAACDPEVALVMRQNEHVDGSSAPSTKYHSGKCEILFQKSGAMRAGTVATNDKHVDFEPNPASKSFCTTKQPVRYNLQTDGNFVFRCTDGTVDYSTHSQGTTGEYFLGIDSKNCDLHIFKGKESPDVLCENPARTRVWTSHKDGLWKIDERLYMAQDYKGLSREPNNPYHMIVSPTDGKLRVRYYYGDGTFKVVNTTGITAPSKYDDYYAQLTPHGRFIFMGIDYPNYPNTAGEYYGRYLEGRSSCYTLSYKTRDSKVDGAIDLIAKTCGTRGFLGSRK